MKKLLVAFAFLAGVVSLSGCGSGCPSGMNTSDPSCPNYQGNYAYGQGYGTNPYQPNPYQPNPYQPNPYQPNPYQPYNPYQPRF